MEQEELFRRLAALRRSTMRGGLRAPHKPLLLLWLFGRLAATGTSAVTFAEVEGPLTRLIDDFGPPATTSGRAAFPFTLLERALWAPVFADGTPVEGPSVSRRGLLDGGAHGRLVPAVETLLGEPGVRADAARLLLDLHFTPALTPLIADACGVDPEADPDAGTVDAGTGLVVRRVLRRPAGFADEVLQAYRYACAMCGYDGALERRPIGLEAAHLRWHSQGGPSEIPNGLALCALHHVLLDAGALGLTPDRRLRVSPHYAARSRAGRALTDLDGATLAVPHPRGDAVRVEHVAWHGRQVFKS